MKSKLLILACAAVVIMLCACQPLNVTSEGSDVVSVAFKVTDEGVSAKAITIGNPLDNANVLYQYKAIPSFTPDNGKPLIGATGDVWTSLPSVYNGSEFKMKFSKGPWTFYFRGVDKNDLTPLYKIAAPVKVTLSSKSTMDIVFNMEADPEGFSGDSGDGFGTVCLDIVAQGYSKEGELIVSYSPIGSANFTELPPISPAKIDDSKTYFVEKLKLASGYYVMKFLYHDNNRKTYMGPYYDVQVMANRNTVVTGVIAHESEYITYFSTPGEEFKYRATFKTTAFDFGNEEKEDQISFELTTLDNNDQQKEKEKNNEINYAKKIGIIHELIWNGRPVNLDSEPYFIGQDVNTKTITFKIFKGMFKKLADEKNIKYTPENVITLRVTWSDGKKTLVAESEPITIFFMNEKKVENKEDKIPAQPINQNKENYQINDKVKQIANKISEQ